jgi:GNAT superfamily N-acetyltransferase
MMRQQNEIEHAIEVFVRGFSACKSVTHPYECFRVGKLWVMRDAPRKNAKNYRKEEWIAYGVEPREVDAAARRNGKGILPVLSVPPVRRRFFVCAMQAMGEPEGDLKAAYKALGYRLLSTEPLFVHDLRKIPRVAAMGTAGQASSATPKMVIQQVKTVEMAERYGKASRTRPIPAEQLTKDASFRQYVALDGDKIVGAVRSVNAGDSAWCANMYVWPRYRRRGIGSALLARMLRDDWARGSKKSVLLSSHTGALVYPRVGYQQIGLLYIFAPPRKAAS